jgi:putative membrane protein
MKYDIKQAVVWMLKGAAMGAANVIPGVSGGTIALITGIFERIIDAIKQFNIQAIKLLAKGRFKDFAKHVDLKFLLFIFIGIGLAIVSIARLFEFLFVNYPIFIWAFFFGLVLASVYFVAKRIEKWNVVSVLSFISGTAVAISISLLSPAGENAAIWYVFLCGVVAACSMILPGLSGSFVLILMGNYQLMIDAVNRLRWDVLVPTVIGAGVGILVFSRILSWVFKRFRNETIGLLSGFILGSLGILWPWKVELTEQFGDKIKTVGYDWYLPQINTESLIAIGIIAVGIVSIWAMEKYAGAIESK